MYPVYPYYSRKEECEDLPIPFPPQSQARPGFEYRMIPNPISDYDGYVGSGKLRGKVAIITGGDSGIGRAVAIAFAKEGADIVIVYLNEHRDAMDTKRRVNDLGQECLLFEADLRLENECEEMVRRTMEFMGRIDILVNNHAIAYQTLSVLDMTQEQLEDTFTTNLFSYIYLIKAAFPYLETGSSIINTSSIVGVKGNSGAMDYAASKGAIINLTKSLAMSLVNNGIRVNAVAPGPVWTPLVVSTFPPNTVSEFGRNTPYKRAAQPFEIAPAYVYLASEDSGYVTGQVIPVTNEIL
ncbi:NAD(P)-dependent dehydrogenase (short-subunit alcohol dehydrogenase family) [Natranaerovirga pectinivora]|uniref:NAD(P)-dependent dehydrogenase (Short-subunit alcohol dehydrogenase family) n=1 Tax=Natranaerovirga pectinivora TaxID=682400 RepID=A0A4R3MNQ3_9FIRM|nr:SDR family oxidoreductase [Natranaerovirga pectinivora]TCT16160.1 NAD(P)-dependent dehydrogenase (short-subunit alcohol dehydrogenase family) [Natranaerovirga pectinivora]